MPAGEKHRWSRKEFEWLIRQGVELLTIAETQQHYGAKSDQGRAWLQQVETWLDSGLAADQRAAVDAASHRLRGYFLRREYQTMDGQAFIECTRETIAALGASAAGYRFTPEVSDEDFVEFLRAAVHEEAKLSMNDVLTAEKIARRAGIDPTTAAACARRALDSALFYNHPGEPESNLYLEDEDVEYEIDRLQRMGGAAPLRQPDVTEVWTIDLSAMSSADLRTVLEKNVRELAAAEALGLHMAGIVLAGSIGEGLLYDALVAEKAQAMTAASAPRGRGNLVKDLETARWNLADYINVAGELGMLAGTTRRMAHDVLREFRNMIHPKLQVEMKLRPDASELKASMAWVEAVARDLAVHRASSKR